MFFLSIFVYFYNTLLSFIYKLYNNKVIFLFYIPYIFVLFLFGIYNYSSLSNDYAIYYNWIDYLVSDNTAFLLRKDPLFQYIVYILYNIWNSVDLVIYSFILVSLIFKFFIGVSFVSKNELWLFFILVFSRFYILHDITQIRISLAISLAMLGYFFFKKNKKIIFLTLFLLAFFIHKSIVVFIFFIFLSRNLNFIYHKNFNIIVFFLGLIFYYLSEFLVDKIMFLFADDRLTVYAGDNYEHNEIIKISSFYVLLKFVILMINFVCWNKFSNNEKVINFFVCSGFLFQMIFSYNGVLGWRFSELFAYFDLFSLIMSIKYFRNDTRSLYLLFIIIISFLILYATYFSRSGI